jgi:pyruvate dehydrogenase E1 component alpha subunit
MIAEFYGSDLGCSKGRGGSMHLIDLSAGFLGSTPIVGGTVPLAVGAAFTSKLQNLGKVVAVFFGDGCFEEGVVHEAMNFSVLHQLPILFICENNNFSVYTPLDQRQSKRKIFEIAQAHGLAAAFGDGNNVRMIEQLVTQAVDNARNGMGPQFLELETYRWLEHCGPDFDNHLGYRTSMNIEAGHSACPIEAYLRDIETSSRQSLMTKITHEIDLEIDAAFDFAFANLDVQQTDLAGGVYA